MTNYVDLTLPKAKISVMNQMKKTGPSVSADAPSIQMLRNYRSADDIRHELLRSYPAFASDRLKTCVVIGAAPEGGRFLDQCAASGINVAAVCDQNKDKVGASFHCHTVHSLDALSKIDRETPVIVASHKGLNSVVHCRELGFTSVAQLALMQILYPETFKPHMFYDGWLEDLVGFSAEYESVAGLLRDRKSLQTLDAILRYRLGLDVTSLIPVLDFNVWHSDNLVRYPDDGVYIDGGAYDGDTVRMYIERSRNRFSRIIAFEPDPDTFSRLRSNFADDDRIEPVNLGMFEKQGILRFSNSASRASLIHDEGEIEVPVTSIDQVLNGSPVTFIKMNIEGAELKALHGAANSIRTHKPTLAISAYHSPAHLWQVPQTILQIDNGYDLYLRQQDGGSVETVIYAVPTRIKQ